MKFEEMAEALDVLNREKKELERLVDELNEKLDEVEEFFPRKQNIKTCCFLRTCGSIDSKRP